MSGSSIKPPHRGAFPLKNYLSEKRTLIDAYLESYFSISSPPQILHEAVVYSLFAGGKRLRPILALTSHEVCGGDPRNIIPQASALELIHTYSLIHDDLPAMDNDDLRRGKPTNHKVFGEAMAILAGDALLTEAFSMIGEPANRNTGPGRKGTRQQKATLRITHSTIAKVIHDVAKAAGLLGMVAGQAQDIIAENAEPNSDVLQFIHFQKTAALIKVSVRMGAVLAGTKKDRVDALTRYGEQIGLAFQVIDDILDIEGTAEELGKSPGSDSKKKKMTYPALYGTEGARQKAKELLNGALDSLGIFSREADPLRHIARYIVGRKA
ncbi:MAG: polyprenyl synthetase family protein [Thermodesulfovibrionales bacterium]|nr:polyprenyl synthetase family protein [Thermodesulfovibrionales bacterium]